MRNRLFLMAALVVLAAACTKEEAFDSSVGNKVTFSASFSDKVQVRTTLVEGNKVEWNVGDEITFFDNTTKIKTATEDSGPNAKFVVDGVKTSARHALYPYDGEAYYSNDAITTSLPNIQTGKPGTFADDLNLAVAQADGTNLPFRNVCGLIKFTITQKDISVIKFSAPGATLAGRVSIKFDNDGLPTVLTYRDTQSELTMYPEGETFAPGTYYFVALPSTFEGFTLTFRKNDLSVAKRVGPTANSIDRNVVLDLGTVDAGLTFTDIIEFADPLVKAACVDGGADTDGDGEISMAEAAAVNAEGMAAIKAKMDENKTEIVSFDELQYFTGFANSGKNLETEVDGEAVGQFEGYTALKSLVFPRTVTRVSLRTCYGCSSLEYVGFHDSMTNIYNNAFNGCSSLKEIHVPKGLVGISNSAFQNCTAAETIYVPNSLETIGKSVFSGCTSVTSLAFDGINNSLTTIEASAFEGCQKMAIASRNLNKVETLGDRAFYNCKAIKNLTMASLTTVPDEAFRGCSKLASVKMQKLTSIGEYAFYACSNLAEMQYSDKITTIGQYAFSGAIFTTLFLPEGLTELADRAYRYLPITSVTVPSTITVIKRAFELCASLEYVIMLPVAPPSLSSTDAFVKVKAEGETPAQYTTIYVPDESLNAYLEADNWTDLPTGTIKPLSEKPAE